MKNLTLENIALACQGLYYGREELKKIEVTSITTDSRKVEKGGLFIPIVGERVDGHTFISQVMDQGALAVLSERPLEDASFPYILVKSSLLAIKDIGEFYLEQLDIPVVGITGSVGKTSTKEMIASVLKEKYRTLKTQGNFNNELGLPLTIFRLRQEDEIAVLEMGISDFGEMTRLAKIAKPNTCVITNIGDCHLENLGDRDGVLRAKTEIFQYLKPGGQIVLNGDDDKLSQVGSWQGISPMFFGTKKREGLSVYADQIKSLGLKGMSCCIHIGEEAFFVHIPAPGRHMVSNALAAAAVGKIYGLSLEEIRRGIQSLEPVGGRFHMIETKDYLIVDDCYNANPMSMKASLDVLREGEGRTVAILGDMGELGEEEAALHQEVGAYVSGCGIDLLLCAGPLCTHMAKGARTNCSKTQIHHFKDREELKEHLSQYVQKGDTILVKASHFMHFEKVVQALEELSA